MKILIIKGKVETDQIVSKDGVAVVGVDFSGVASDLWSLDWDSVTKKGEIEWATGPVPNQSVTSEAEIDSALDGVTLQTMLTRRQVILDEEQAAANQAAAEADEAERAAADTREEWEKNRLNFFDGGYPVIGDQLDDLYHAGVFSADMTAKIKKVKDDNPKG